MREESYIENERHWLKFQSDDGTIMAFIDSGVKPYRVFRREIVALPGRSGVIARPSLTYATMYAAQLAARAYVSRETIERNNNNENQY